MNISKVIIGGLIAGLVINIGEVLFNGFVFKDKVAAVSQQLGLPAEPASTQIAMFIMIGFLFGILAVWLYAAIRPRYGPGPKTATLAGLAVWALSWALPTLGFVVMGIWPQDFALLGIVWGLFEVVLATVIGASLYKEPAAA
jgi:hypothetical protein